MGDELRSKSGVFDLFNLVLSIEIDIFVQNILKQETYGRLPWQFCNFTYEIIN